MLCRAQEGLANGKQASYGLQDGAMPQGPHGHGDHHQGDVQDGTHMHYSNSVSTQHCCADMIGRMTVAPVCLASRKKTKRKDYAFWRQFNKCLASTLGCNLTDRFLAYAVTAPLVLHWQAHIILRCPIALRDNRSWNIASTVMYQVAIIVQSSHNHAH